MRSAAVTVSCSGRTTEDSILDFEQGKDVIDVSGTGLTAADFAAHVGVGLVTFDQDQPRPDRVVVTTRLHADEPQPPPALPDRPPRRAWRSSAGALPAATKRDLGPDRAGPAAGWVVSG